MLVLTIGLLSPKLMEVVGIPYQNKGVTHMKMQIWLMLMYSSSNYKMKIEKS